jgi:hypothetical protein
MNAVETTYAGRTNRRRKSPARAIAAALGRRSSFRPAPEHARQSMPTRTFAESWPRLVIA